MSAAVRVIVKSISSVVIELVNKSDCKRSNYFYRQCREKVNSVYGIGDAWPYDVSDNGDYNEQNWCDDQVPGFQNNLMKF